LKEEINRIKILINGNTIWQIRFFATK
jgi:hypothetical protein